MSSPSSPSPSSSSSSSSPSSSSSSPSSPAPSIPPLFSFLTNIRHIPCLRDGLLVGMGLGTIASLHSFIRHRAALRAVNVGVTIFGVGGIVGYFYCRWGWESKRDQIRFIMDNQETIMKLSDAKAKKEAEMGITKVIKAGEEGKNQ